MPMNNLHEVMIDLLKDTYHAEKQLVKALPKMVKAASDEDLSSAFTDHLRETEGHVERLEKAFRMLEMKPTAKPCHGMMGLVEEGQEVIKEGAEGEPAAADAALIAAAQKVEHYEICAYGTLATYAETLGLDDLAEVFKGILAEEEQADDKLSEIAQGSVNSQAAQAGEMSDDDEGEDDEEDDDRPARPSSSSRRRQPAGNRTRR
jgi:ferritin-like metal-binding protein YciE